MRNEASSVSRLMIAATIALPALAFIAGCQSAPQTNTGAGGNPNPAAMNPAAPAANDDTSDAALAARVKAALVADPELRRLPVSVATFRGTVQLVGYVESDNRYKRPSPWRAA